MPETHYTDERLAHIIRMTARQFNRCLSIRLADYGITFGQWAFLRILWDKEGISQSQLSSDVGVTAPTTHTAMRKLEALGLVHRSPIPDNKRQNRVFLTHKGRGLRQHLEPLAIDVNAVSLIDIDDETYTLVRQALTRIYDNLLNDEMRANKLGKRMPPK